MFPKLIGVFFALCLYASFAIAAPQRASLEPFVDKIASRTGLSREQVREHAIEALRESGNFTREELDRIRRPGGEGFELAKANEAVKLLQGNVKFRLRTGLEATRLASIAGDASLEFVKLASQQSARELRHVAIDLQLADVRMQVNRALIAKYELLVQDSAASNDIRSKYSAALEDNVKLAGQARTSANELYTALTTFLVSRGITYATYIENGYAVPSVEVSGDAKNAFLKTLDLPAELVALGGRARRAIVLPTEAASESSYDGSSQTLFVGADAMRRIN